MQEIHSIGNGMLFCGGGGGDRRLRLHLHHHNQNQQQQHHQHQALKCPRCDSFNTKFCYYNNYNLSQPRHFCKNCRRYWTKGGVLRNVPVGGASRKSKRPNNNNNKSSSFTSVTAPATTTPPPPDRNEINSHSSSESSATTVATTEAVSAPVVSNAFSVNPALELEQVSVFSETGSLTTNDALPFGFGNNNHVLDASSFRFGVTRQQHENDQLQVVTGNGTLGQCHEEFATASFLDRAVPLEFFSSLQNKAAHGGGFGPLDQSMFDLPNAVDQPYWAHGHWSGHHNPTLFHHFP